MSQLPLILEIVLVMMVLENDVTIYRRWLKTLMFYNVNVSLVLICIFLLQVLILMSLLFFLCGCYVELSCY